MKSSSFLLPLLFLFPFTSCSLFQKSTSPDEGKAVVKEATEEVDSTKVEAEKKDSVQERSLYRASETRVHDLVHTVLDVSFDLEKHYLHGEAEIDLTPHFYPTDSLVLDAKGFELQEVALVTDTGNEGLAYEYDGRKIRIGLDSTYTRTDSFRVFIDYTAKPEELESKMGGPIQGEQGLYFIDPEDEDPDKPTQIWTQGETESSSCWFPTIDAPNQKMTQEISITVRDDFKTLSNGALQYSIENGDGTRTDHWEQELPHPPYLTMMAIGDFAVVEDEWEGMPVNYWVEKEYEESAMDIFKNTPEMLSFYSDTLGFEYPWEKYDQVVVRDFVAGAMENTSATVHGSMQRKTERELIDGNNEPTIAHELIHHWFGNIVTCESWANLPLNESFATYGEYLWEEHKYGRDAADKLLQDKLNTYLRQARQKQVDLIRYDYADKENMFDAFSYHKGGCVLHMLRKQVGNDAFFQALEKYLKDNAYEPVEIHDLRLAFEEVTGKDLNWFFEQWFLDKGHPELRISYAYDSTESVQKVIIAQEQDFEEMPLYKLPMKVDLYYGAEAERRSISLEASLDTFSFEVPRKPDLVNVDAQKMLLAEKEDEKSTSAYAHQFRHAPLYLDRYEAVQHCSRKSDSLSGAVLLSALEDPHPRIRTVAVRNLNPAVSHYPEKAYRKAAEMAKSDADPTARANALSQLNSHFPDKEHMEVYERALKDSSYWNIATALREIRKEDPERAMEIAPDHEDSQSGQVLLSVAGIYADHGAADEHSFFTEKHEELSGFTKMNFIRVYGSFIKGKPRELTLEGVKFLTGIVLGKDAWYVKMTAARVIRDIRSDLEDRIASLEEELEELEKKAKDEEQELSEEEKAGRERKEAEIRKFEEGLNKLESSLKRIRDEVDDQRVLRPLEG